MNVLLPVLNEGEPNDAKPTTLVAVDLSRVVAAQFFQRDGEADYAVVFVAPDEREWRADERRVGALRMGDVAGSFRRLMDWAASQVGDGSRFTRVAAFRDDLPLEFGAAAFVDMDQVDEYALVTSAEQGHFWLLKVRGVVVGAARDLHHRNMRDWVERSWSRVPGSQP